MLRKGTVPLLCFDVGNTSTSYGFFHGKMPMKSGYIPTNEIPKNIVKMMPNLDGLPKMDAVVSSVVPEITRKIGLWVRGNQKMRRAIRRLYIIGQDLRVPIKHKYRHQNRIGNDRLVTAYGGIRLYGTPLLIFDFGTAITCDYISRDGVFEGGLIIPGPEISLEALCEKAALLPKIGFPKEYKGLLGRDTVGGMKAGVLQGYGALTDGLVERFRGRYGSSLRVVATGGLAKTIARHTTRVDIVDPLLTLKSIACLFIDLCIPAS